MQVKKLIVLLVSNSDVFDKMYQEINRQNTFYFWIIGIVLTISIAIAGFFGILQWRLSDKQVQNLKAETKSETINEIAEKYKLDKLEDSYSKLQNLTEQISELKKQNDTLSSSIKSLENIRQVRVIQDIQVNLKLALSDNGERPSSFEGRLMFLLSEFINNAFVQDVLKMSTLVFVFNEVSALKDNKAAQRIKKFIEANGKNYLDQWDNLSKTFNDKGSGTTQKD